MEATAFDAAADLPDYDGDAIVRVLDEDTRTLLRGVAILVRHVTTLVVVVFALSMCVIIHIFSMAWLVFFWTQTRLFLGSAWLIRSSMGELTAPQQQQQQQQQQRDAWDRARARANSGKSSSRDVTSSGHGNGDGKRAATGIGGERQTAHTGDDRQTMDGGLRTGLNTNGVERQNFEATKGQVKVTNGHKKEMTDRSTEEKPTGQPVTAESTTQNDQQPIAQQSQTFTQRSATFKPLRVTEHTPRQHPELAKEKKKEEEQARLQREWLQSLQSEEEEDNFDEPVRPAALIKDATNVESQRQALPRFTAEQLAEAKRFAAEATKGRSHRGGRDRGCPQPQASSQAPWTARTFALPTATTATIPRNTGRAQLPADYVPPHLRFSKEAETSKASPAVGGGEEGITATEDTPGAEDNMVSTSQKDAQSLDATSENAKFAINPLAQEFSPSRESSERPDDDEFISEPATPVRNKQDKTQSRLPSLGDSRSTINPLAQEFCPSKELYLMPDDAEFAPKPTDHSPSKQQPNSLQGREGSARLSMSADVLKSMNSSATLAELRAKVNVSNVKSAPQTAQCKQCGRWSTVTLASSEAATTKLCTPCFAVHDRIQDAQQIIDPYGMLAGGWNDAESLSCDSCGARDHVAAQCTNISNIGDHKPSRPLTTGQLIELAADEDVFTSYPSAAEFEAVSHGWETPKKTKRARRVTSTVQEFAPAIPPKDPRRSMQRIASTPLVPPGLDSTPSPHHQSTFDAIVSGSKGEASSLDGENDEGVFDENRGQAVKRASSAAFKVAKLKMRLSQPSRESVPEFDNSSSQVFEGRALPSAGGGSVTSKGKARMRRTDSSQNFSEEFDYQSTPVKQKKNDHDEASIQDDQPAVDEDDAAKEPETFDDTNAEHSRTEAEAQNNEGKREARERKKAAREVLKEAWCEREEARLKVVAKWDLDVAQALEEATARYHEKRDELIALMTDNVLNEEDSRIYPRFGKLATDVPKVKPQGASAIVAELRRKRKSEAETKDQIPEQAQEIAGLDPADAQYKDIEKRLRALEHAENMGLEAIHYWDNPPQGRVSRATWRKDADARISRARAYYDKKWKELAAAYPEGMPDVYVERFPKVLKK